ncbi:MAG: hypothetical protein KBB71_10160, partial [Lentimicrobiaceae bacterium]|nr:hypothetical protein [Lentimicrobiaceae bacterium]
MKKQSVYLKLFVAVTLFLSILTISAQDRNDAPDVIFHNGSILTMETAQPEAEAIAIRENLIIAVGNNQEILDMQNTETSLIDLKGKTIMPGIVDP